VVATPQPGGSEPLPDDVAPARLRRRVLQVVALLGVLLLAVALAAGAGRGARPDRARGPGLARARPSPSRRCPASSYAVMFRPVFCNHMSWRTSWEIGWAELGVGSLVPASGAGGLALGAWILRRGGMPAERIARRSVAFFLIKSSVNFVAVAVSGVHGGRRRGRTARPAHRCCPRRCPCCVIVGVLLLPRLGHGQTPGRTPEARCARRRSTRRASSAAPRGRPAAPHGHPLILGGAIGYWAFDNAVLWATFHAFGIGRRSRSCSWAT
jgi:hypothetical protein